MQFGDFLGAFAVLETDAGVLMVENERRIEGRLQRVWDLPGGRVEPGGFLEETLRRELREETALDVDGSLEFLFYQEGERVADATRQYAWRSFFFGVQRFVGVPRASAEVFDVRFVPRAEMEQVLHAPYHDSFREWLQKGGRVFGSTWAD